MDQLLQVIAVFAIGIQFLAAQPLFDEDRPQLELSSVDPAIAKLMPEPEQLGMFGQGVTTKLLHLIVLGQFQDSQDVRFQMRPAELPRPL